MTDDIVNADTEGGQKAGEAIIEAVESQLSDNNPPETQQTLDRLMASGESRENAMRYIAGALVIEIFGAIKHNKPYNNERYVKNLNALPKDPSESV